MRNYYQILPEKVYQELSEIVDLIRPEIIGFKLDYLKEVISVIACNVRKDNEDPPLKMTYFRRLVPYAEKYLNNLVEIGVIKRSPFYIPKEISYRYSFTPEYESKYIIQPLNNAKLIHRINKAYTVTGKEAVKNVRECSFQVKFLKQLTLADGWEELVNSYRDDTEVYNSVLASAMRIVNNDIFYSRDATERRFHSNVTNMKKELRPYLRVNGKPLVNVDIKNSQPYLSTIILTYPAKVAHLAKNISLSMLLQSLKVSTNQDVKNYIKLVADGLFYEYLMKEFASEGIVLSRDDTKKHMLRILFAPNKLPKNEINRKCRLIFKKCFPTVHRIFSKVRGRDQGNKFENSNRFFILLATIESYLVLDVIMKRIHKEHPEIIALSIHDSIMTGILTDSIEAVRKIIIQEMTDFIGFSPKINIEDILKDKREEREENKVLIQYDVTNLASYN